MRKTAAYQHGVALCYFSKHDLNYQVLLTIMTPILKNPAIVHYIIVTQRSASIIKPLCLANSAFFRKI